MILFSKFFYDRYFHQNNQSSPKTYAKMIAEVYAQSPNDTNEIIFLGNSITASFLVNEYHQDLNIKNRGISGNKTIDILRRLPEVTESNPHKIFLMIGVNDVINGIEENTIETNYRNIVDQIITASPKTEIYLQSILPVSNRVSEYLLSDEKISNAIIDRLNEKIKSLALQLNLNFIDLNSKFRLNGELNPAFSWDGIHINAEGYKLWNKSISKFLVNYADED